MIGKGVTIDSTGKSAVLDFLVKSSISLTAPTNGPLAGILLFQDRDSCGT